MRNLKIAGWIMMILSALSGAFYVLSLGGGRGDVFLLASSISLLVSSLVISGINDALHRIIGLLTDQRALLKHIATGGPRPEPSAERSPLLKTRARE